MTGAVGTDVMRSSTRVGKMMLALVGEGSPQTESIRSWKRWCDDAAHPDLYVA